MNQFFYTRKEAIEDTEPVEYAERVTEVPNINTKTNKVIGTKKKVEVFQTEAYLTGDDKIRFEKLTNIEL